MTWQDPRKFFTNFARSRGCKDTLYGYVAYSTQSGWASSLVPQKLAPPLFDKDNRAYSKDVCSFWATGGGNLNARGLSPNVRTMRAMPSRKPGRRALRDRSVGHSRMTHHTNFIWTSTACACRDASLFGVGSDCSL